MGSSAALLALRRILAPLRERIYLSLARGVVRLVDDDRKAQEIQVDLLAGEVRTLERFQGYGFSSHPQPGAETLQVFINGNRDHGIIVQVEDRRFRLTGLEAGEVAIHDDLGKRIVLKRNGDVEVSGTRLLVKADCRIEGDLYVEGKIEAEGTIADLVAAQSETMDSMRTIYNGHDHDRGGHSSPTGLPNQTM